MLSNSVCKAARAITAAVMFVASPATASADDRPIRLGWQIPWATQGQLVQALKHSNIPELTEIELEYVGFSYGGPLNRAALGGEIDVLLTADHPAAVLVSKQRGFKIVARMMYNRVCIYAPAGSEITSVAQLSGKSVMGPIGAAAERVALAEIAQAGIALNSLKLASLDMGQQNAIVRAGSSWDGVDALFGFDPLPAIWEADGRIQIIDCGPVVSIVAASEEMLTSRKEELADFLKAFLLSWDAFRQNPESLGELFLDEAGLTAHQSALDQAASIEPNVEASSLDEIRLTFTDTDFATLVEATRFLVDRGTIPAGFDILSYVDTSVLEMMLDDGDAAALAAAVELNK